MTGDQGDAAVAAEVLAGLAADHDGLAVNAFERGFLAGAAAALRMLADAGHDAAPDQDGRGRR